MLMVKITLWNRASFYVTFKFFFWLLPKYETPHADLFFIIVRGILGRIQWGFVKDECGLM